jgi:hypothetical protein
MYCGCGCLVGWGFIADFMARGFTVGLDTDHILLWALLFNIFLNFFFAYFTSAEAFCAVACRDASDLLQALWSGFTRAMAALLLGLPLVITVMILTRHKLHAVLISVLVVLFLTIVFSYQLIYVFEFDDVFVIVFMSIIMLNIQVLILLSAAPAKTISRRLIFLATGLILLIALNDRRRRNRRCAQCAQWRGQW